MVTWTTILTNHIILFPIVISLWTILSELHVPYRRQKGGSSLSSSMAHSQPLTISMNHKHSITFKGLAHLNVKFQFSHNPVNPSLVLANEQYGESSHLGIKKSSSILISQQSGILFHKSCLQHQPSNVLPQSFHFHLRFKDFVNKISHSFYTNK